VLPPCRLTGGLGIAIEECQVLPTFDWDISPTIFKYPEWLSFLPGDGLRYYSLLYVCVFFGGYRLLDWQIRRAGGSEEDANDFVLYGVIAVLGGSRIGHVLFYDFDKFLADPAWLFRIWEGGLASHGGAIGLIIGMWLFTKFRRQSFVEGADRFAFSAALGATLIRLGNFFNSEIVGRKTDQSWGVRFVRVDGPTGDLRHPSQLYEFALGLLVMASLYVADRAWGKEKRPRGALISLFFAVYFTGRFFVEYVKDYQTLPSDSPLTMGQILSIVPALIGYVGLYISFKKRIPAKWNVYKPPSDDDAEEEPDDDGVDEDVDEALASKG
jgi:phosphatidylglycerol---prolipoprotein diacylglyceryl transferase